MDYFPPTFNYQAAKYYLEKNKPTVVSHELKQYKLLSELREKIVKTIESGSCSYPFIQLKGLDTKYKLQLVNEIFYKRFPKLDCAVGENIVKYTHSDPPSLEVLEQCHCFYIPLE